ncbi:MAG: ATP-dependent helicase [Thermoproteota archaeon]|nr:MAG: ATP-dependent helicase [Candidatus Korarchaeota archaeon]
MVSMGAFSLLCRELREKLAEVGVERETEIQEKAIPLILEGRSVLLIAPAGWGKTEAAVLPVLHMMREVKEAGVKLLYITPLRSLNRDLLNRVARYAHALGFRVGVRHGDTSSGEREAQARHPPDVLITTPESLQAILPGRMMRAALRAVRWVVVDEVHEFLESKRGSQLAVLLERVREVCGGFQVIGLSATIGSPESVAEFLAGGGAKPEVVSLDIGKRVEIRVEYHEPSGEDASSAEKVGVNPWLLARARRIVELAKASGRVLVFTNTRSTAELLSRVIAELSPDVEFGTHHSSLSRDIRVEVESSLKSGFLLGVVCTSSLQLGIDIGELELVVQYGSPRTVTNLLQRVGRAGHRAWKKSSGVVLAETPLDVAESLAIVRLAKRGWLEKPRIPEKPLDVLAVQLAGLTLDGRRSLREVYDVVRRAYPYRKLTVDELKEVVKALGWSEQHGRLVAKRGVWRYYYENLSVISEREEVEVVDDRGQIVGYMDPRFVALYLSEGEAVVFQGKVWIVAEISRDKVKLAPSREHMGEIPWWEGETIPVPKEVADEVFEVLREASEEPGDYARAAESLARYEAVDYQAALSLIKLARGTLQALGVLPSRDIMVAEKVGDSIAFYYPLGRRGAEALGRAAAFKAASLVGRPVGLRISPYGFVIEGVEELSPREALPSPGEFEEALSSSLRYTPLLKLAVSEVAGRLGAREEAEKLLDLSPEQLAAAIDGTALLKQAIGDIQHKYLDAGVAKEVLERIHDGSIRLRVAERDEPTPLFTEVSSRFPEVVRPSSISSLPASGSLRDRVVAELSRSPLSAYELSRRLGAPLKDVLDLLVQLKDEGAVRDVLVPDAMARIWVLRKKGIESARVAVSELIELRSKIRADRISSVSSLIRALDMLGAVSPRRLLKMTGSSSEDFREALQRALESRRAVLVHTLAGGQLILLSEQFSSYVMGVKPFKMSKLSEVTAELLKIMGAATAEELARRLGESTRSVRRSLAELQALGHAVCYGREWKYRRRVESWEWRPHGLLLLLLKSGPKTLGYLARVCNASRDEVLEALESTRQVVKLIVRGRGVRRVLYCLRSHFNAILEARERSRPR